MKSTMWTTFWNHSSHSISLVCIRTKLTLCFCNTINHQAMLQTRPSAIWPRWKMSWAFNISAKRTYLSKQFILLIFSGSVIWSREFKREESESWMGFGNMLQRSFQRSIWINQKRIQQLERRLRLIRYQK